MDKTMSYITFILGAVIGSIATIFTILFIAFVWSGRKINKHLNDINNAPNKNI